ncbi:MAG: hypothetical protein MUO62_11105 [Anaerolineales bacterium]|nr:hypothetical protein [Anaerolineales bacterium]
MKIETLKRMLVAGLVLIIILFKTPTIEAWTKLIQANISTAQHLKLSLSHIFSPNSGQEVLPVQVQQLLSLLQTHQISSYQLSNQLMQNPLIFQRTIESAWPTKMEGKSSYLLISFEEIKNYASCVQIDQREDVALVYCD